MECKICGSTVSPEKCRLLPIPKTKFKPGTIVAMTLEPIAEGNNYYLIEKVVTKAVGSFKNGTRKHVKRYLAKRVYPTGNLRFISSKRSAKRYFKNQQNIDRLKIVADALFMG